MKITRILIASQIKLGRNLYQLSVINMYVSIKSHNIIKQNPLGFISTYSMYFECWQICENKSWVWLYDYLNVVSFTAVIQNEVKE